MPLSPSLQEIKPIQSRNDTGMRLSRPLEQNVSKTALPTASAKIAMPGWKSISVIVLYSSFALTHAYGHRGRIVNSDGTKDAFPTLGRNARFRSYPLQEHSDSSFSPF